jgi:hypothetical protein
MALREPRKRGTKPAPRLELDPAFVTRIYESGRPLWSLSLAVGFPFSASLSTILRGHVVIGTALNVERIAALARQINFPADRVFVQQAEPEEAVTR